MLYFCKKCGRIVQEVYQREKQICDYCNNDLHPVPDEFLLGKRKCIFNDDLKQQFIDEYIKSSPEFDQYLFDHRDEDLARRRMEDSAKLAHGKAIMESKNCVPKCPTCGSTNINKITITTRAVKTAAFGVFGAIDDAGKTYKCGNCGSKF